MVKIIDSQVEKLKEEKAQKDWQIKALVEDINNNPLRRFLPLVTRSGNFRGEVKYLTKNQYRKYLRKEPKPVVVDKNGRIPWHYALDEIASEYGYDSDEAMKEGIEKLSEQYRELENLRQDKRTSRESIKTTRQTLPKIEVTKLTNEEPPVYSKDGSTTGIMVEANGLEMKARRNPSFYQISDNDPTTPSYRIRYASQARKIMNMAAQDHIKDIAKARGLEIPKRRSISKNKSRITPPMQRLR